MRKTGWYSKWQKPVREGWYERDYSKAEGFFAHDGQTIFRDLWLQADSGNGYWYVDEPKGQINDAWWENLPWRGRVDGPVGPFAEE